MCEKRCSDAAMRDLSRLSDSYERDSPGLSRPGLLFNPRPFRLCSAAYTPHLALIFVY